MTRNGKIARLPREIREQLNRRLQDGEQGIRLVKWLNALPDAQRVLAAEFGQRPINEQNLSEWKNGGYVQWIGHQDLLANAQELAERSGELQQAAPELTEHLSAAVSARFAAALVAWDGESSPQMMRELRALRALSTLSPKEILRTTWKSSIPKNQSESNQIKPHILMEWKRTHL